MRQRLDEVTRAGLLNKSRSADIVKSYKTTRYERRNVVHPFNEARHFNRIDQNALWKADLLSFIIPVHGESDDYEVEVLFEGICTNIRNQVKLNNNKLEYKCIYRAIIDSINKYDVYVGCSCPDYKYRFQYWSSKGRYNSMAPQLIPAKITNPNNSKGAGCKHILSILANLDWAFNLATSIYNYTVFMEQNYPDKYYNVMFPAIYGMSYERAQDLGILDDEELANTMDNPEEQDIDQAIEQGGSHEGEVPEDEIEPEFEEEEEEA